MLPLRFPLLASFRLINYFFPPRSRPSVVVVLVDARIVRLPMDLVPP